MPQNKNIVLSALKCKCPQCRKGKLFLKPFYDLSSFSKMPENCPVCGFKYEIEPGFYWGAMYFSYGFSVAMTLILAFLTYEFLNNPAVWVYLIISTPTIILLSPVSLRYSRVLMIYFFGGAKYSPNTIRKQP